MKYLKKYRDEIIETYREIDLKKVSKIENVIIKKLKKKEYLHLW